MRINQIFSIGCIVSVWLGMWLGLSWQVVTAAVVALVVLSVLMATIDIVLLGVLEQTAFVNFEVEFVPDASDD